MTLRRLATPPNYLALFREAGAVFRKEWRSESRNRSALLTGWLLSFVTVFTLAFAFYGRELSSEAGAGMILAAILFAGVGTLTRVFVSEEEQGTADMLRLWSRPVAVFGASLLLL